jgi:hypothetical protein
MILLGIDPGVRGGMAIISTNDNTAPQLVDAIDIHVIGLKANASTYSGFRAWILAQQPQHAIIERAQAMPRQGASSGFKYGRAEAYATKAHMRQWGEQIFNIATFALRSCDLDVKPDRIIVPKAGRAIAIEQSR